MLHRRLSSLNRVFACIAVIMILGGSIYPSMQVTADLLESDDSLRIAYHGETGKVSFIGADPASPFRLSGGTLEALSPQDRGFRFLDHFSEMLGLNDPSQELRVQHESVETTAKRASARYQQVYKGIPILAGELIVNTDARGRLLSISGEISPDLSLSTVPKLSSGEAVEIALGAIAKTYGVEPSELKATGPELWIFDERLLLPSSRLVELVWRMDINGLSGQPINELVLVNAQTGGISTHFNQIDVSWNEAALAISVPMVDEFQNPTPIAIPSDTPISTPQTPDSTSTPILIPTSSSTMDPTSTTTQSSEITLTPTHSSEPSETSTLEPSSTPKDPTTGSPSPTVTGTQILLPSATGSLSPTATGTPLPSSTPIASISPSPSSVVEAVQDVNGGETWYVSSGGDDSNDCATTSTTCATISGAIAKATAGDTILVGSGVYTGSGTEVIEIDQDVFVLGGWDATFTNQTGMSTIDGEGIRRGIFVPSGVTATIERFVVQNGFLTLANGGGISNSGDLTINESVVRDSHSNMFGGGISTRNGSLVLNSSSISNNSAPAGGGIEHLGGSLAINNSTISGNYGGGIYASSLEMSSSTVTGNLGGGIEAIAPASLRNSIVAGNKGYAGLDCEGTVNSLGYNLIGHTYGCSYTSGTGDVIGVDPGIGPLMSSPGFHPLSSISAARNAGNPAGCLNHLSETLDTDQRGVARVGICDIGAFEFTNPGTESGIVAIGDIAQRTAPGTEFYAPLSVAILDNAANPVPDVEVTFTGPTSGAGGLFISSGTHSTTATSDEFGVATSAPFKANSIAGDYLVTATASGVGGAVDFSLSNLGWYVSLAGNDANDCDDPLSPCVSVSGVLGKAGFVPGDTVLMTGETYTGTSADVALLSESVRLLGGWNSEFTTKNGQTTIDGESLRRGIRISPFTSSVLDGLDVVNGGASEGIQNNGDLVLLDCSVRDGQSQGITNSRYLQIDTCTLSGNANREVWNEGYAEITKSLISDGTGIRNAGVIFLTNTTVSRNIAVGVWNLGLASVNNATISANVSSTGAGIQSSGVFELRNSIVARNSATNLDAHDCDGTITSFGHNLIEEQTDCTVVGGIGDLLGINPSMRPLEDSGGPTLTHALLLGSPAIDAGDPANPGSGGTACEVEDQRGVDRPVGSSCDIGAFEGSESGLTFPLLLTYDADNSTYLPGSFACSHLQPDCTDGSDLHADAAHRYALDSYDFFATYHGRDSLDNDGLRIVSSVHYQSSFDNAFWSSAEQQVIYGDAFGFPLADDLVAHELTHGVTDYTSDLFYYYQSGAISESFSDLWGEFVDQTNGAGDDSAGVKWLIGEDVGGLGAIRDMENPPAHSDPDKMTSPYYYTDNADLNAMFGPWGDNGGVHTNSGVNNKAVYLMTDGGSFNGYTISGLGIDKVAAIYYEVQTNLLTSGADYRDLYYALYQGCLNLIPGPQGITTVDCQQVRYATEAVEMHLEPSAGYNPDVEICQGGGNPIDLFFDDLESGGGNWGTGAVSGSNAWFIGSFFATSPVSSIWGDDSYASSDSFVSMISDITLPPASQPFLHFNHAFGFEDPDYDGGWLEYSTNGGSTWLDAGPLFDDGLDYTGSINTVYGDGDNTHTGRSAFVGDSHGYVSNRYDLSSLAGGNVRFRWRISTDSAYFDWGWFVDNVRIYTCGSPASTPVFEDVPEDYWARDYIEILYDEGYIAGCQSSPLKYCPHRVLSRAESAVFVMRGAYGAIPDPPYPPPSTPSFDDVDPAYWGYGWIESMWTDGFTAGCGTDPLIYCPLREHTRAEGSVFFLRIKNGVAYTPPPPVGIFADVSIGAWYDGWVEAAYSDGLLPPCQTDPLKFCPEDTLDRSWAAYMMVWAKGGFGLPTPTLVPTSTSTPDPP